ncbi:hypothetical protein C7B62_24445 [Pleurocapsa sp. CCALA 161]|nr:hypothetical protein C7B62_24445 [Pleurocapsa sp. CCALA 161]
MCSFDRDHSQAFVLIVILSSLQILLKIIIMVSRKNLQPLTDLQQQFRDIIEPILAEITINNQPLDTLDSARLQEVLLERDLDDILCLKDLYSEDLNLEDKAEEVYNILQEILNSNTKPSSVDKLIEQLIEDCVVYDLKVQKRKELTLDYQRAFNGLVIPFLYEVALNKAEMI